MCGFYGLFSKKSLSKKEIVFHRKVADRIKYRGPDFSGEYISQKKNFYTKHHRLSIIDLKDNSNQPFKYKNFTIIFNGEIYNYKEIKKKLKRDFLFKTTGDTEVLLYSWIKWGKKFHKYVDGMYSFVIYDEQDLYLVSDNFSEKPLFYTKINNQILFSSEKTILSMQHKLKKNIDSNQINSFLSLGFFPYEFSIHKDLNYLKPATIIKFDKNLNKKETVYWKKNNKNFFKKNIFGDNDKKKLKNLLIESIKNRLTADVPVAHFMSSGFDSTLIAAICKKELNYDLKSYTVKTPDNIEEIKHVKEICSFLKMPNKVVNFNYDKNFNKISKKLLNIFGEPNDNITTLMFMEMSKIIKQDGFKVALCGLGGDELILGYNKYSFLKKINKYTLNQNQILNKLFNTFKFIIFGELKNKFDKFILPNKFDKFINFRNVENFKNISSSFSHKLKDLDNDNNILDSMYNFDTNNTLPLSYIKALDLGSMRSSIEVRSPFLNKKLFVFLRSFKNDVFFKGTNKKIFKDILLDYLPDNLIPKKKIGFSYPLNNIYKEIDFKNINESLNNNVIFLKKKDSIKRNDKNFNKIIFRLLLLNNFLNEKN
ncbi:asparagine synthase (glutamine-hydrolyzing) [Candidatus Pelagibacter sp.]|nr:asparagine synthase (glutamine-hydrolyzing) [Candidatus Pelagibacter sp.]